MSDTRNCKLQHLEGSQKSGVWGFQEELETREELDGFRKHVTSLAALDFLVSLKYDVFVMTHGGNFEKLIIGAHEDF